MAAGWRDVLNLVLRWHTGRRQDEPQEPGGICVEATVRPAVNVRVAIRPLVEIESTVSPAVLVRGTVQCGG